MNHTIAFPNSPHKQADYELRIESGQKPVWAEMLAARQAPGIGLTTAIFLEGRHDGGINDPLVAAYYRNVALKNGVNPCGKTYCSSLASFPGDPTAWISSVKEAKDHAEMMGLKLEGGINFTSSKYEEPAGDENIEFSTSDDKYEVGDDVVSDEMEMQAESNPELLLEWQNNETAFLDAKDKMKRVLSGKA